MLKEGLLRALLQRAPGAPGGAPGGAPVPWEGAEGYVGGAWAALPPNASHDAAAGLAVLAGEVTERSPEQMLPLPLVGASCAAAPRAPASFAAPAAPRRALSFGRLSEQRPVPRPAATARAADRQLAHPRTARHCCYMPCRQASARP